jgi:hypothetical protein
MPDFLQGILAALLPSMLIVAWLVWRATPVDELGSLARVSSFFDDYPAAVPFSNEISEAITEHRVPLDGTSYEVAERARQLVNCRR